MPSTQPHSQLYPALRRRLSLCRRTILTRRSASRRRTARATRSATAQHSQRLPAPMSTFVRSEPHFSPVSRPICVFVVPGDSVGPVGQWDGPADREWAGRSPPSVTGPTRAGRPRYEVPPPADNMSGPPLMAPAAMHTTQPRQACPSVGEHSLERDDN